MTSYQYIYVMQGLSKTYPGGRKVLDGIHLSFLPVATFNATNFFVVRHGELYTSTGQYNLNGITSALVGIMVGAGELDPEAPAPIPEWRHAEDPRGEITLANLLHMSILLERLVNR